MKTKRCTRCGELKPLDDFYFDRGRPGGKCKLCHRAAVNRYRLAHPERIRPRVRNEHLRRKYGITSTDFDRMLDAQGGRCAICGTDRPGGAGTWHVDHNHETGVVRGLLCCRCNRNLGMLENVEWRTAAEQYLAREVLF